MCKRSGSLSRTAPPNAALPLHADNIHPPEGESNPQCFIELNEAICVCVSYMSKPISTRPTVHHKGGKATQTQYNSDSSQQIQNVPSVQRGVRHQPM
jgi:hypothetical protein